MRWLACIAALSLFCVAGSDPSSVAASRSRRDEPLLFLVMGQSNAAGRAEAGRLANLRYNPRFYTRTPEGIYIYEVDCADPEGSGQWKAYSAGKNSRSDGNADQFGPELALAQAARRKTGRDVFIVKAAFGATALSPGIPTARPGNWTDIGLQLAIRDTLMPAVRALEQRGLRYRPRFLGILWWQGETDALHQVSRSIYAARLRSFQHNVDRALERRFHNYSWVLVGLNYLKTPAEGAVNAALCDVANSKSRTSFISSRPYPRRMDLAADLADPIARTQDDDEHASYIAQLAVGEAAAETMLSQRQRHCPSVD